MKPVTELKEKGAMWGTMWNRNRKRTCCILSIITLLTLEISFLASAAETSGALVEASEYQLKAAWLKMIARFIEWPKNSDVNDPSKPFIIGIVGNSPLLREVYAFYIHGNQQIKKKPVVIRAVPDRDDIPHCHLLFISRSAKYRLAKIIAAVENLPLLTVSDTEGFADRGVHINFIIRHRNLWFEVNRQAVEKSGLVVSHHLLKVAKRIISNIEEEKMITPDHR